MTVTNRSFSLSKSAQQAATTSIQEEYKTITSPATATTPTTLNNVMKVNGDEENESTSSRVANSACLTSMANKVEGRIDSFDHVTFWVGNAKQSAAFYMTQFGFKPYAFCGLETGSRNLACHVVKLNDTIIQFVSAVEPNNETINTFLLSHGDAVRDVAFRVENIEALLEHALKQGAELVSPLETIVFNQEGNQTSSLKDNLLPKYVLKKATIKTFGDVTHTFIERNYEYERAIFLPGYKKPSLEVSGQLDVILI